MNSYYTEIKIVTAYVSMLAPPQNQLFCEILNSINLDGLVFEHSIGSVDNLAIVKHYSDSYKIHDAIGHFKILQRLH